MSADHSTPQDTGTGQPSDTGLKLADWLQERRDNCLRIASMRTGDEQRGWLEDMAYFDEAITKLAALKTEREAHRLERARLERLEAALVEDNYVAWLRYVRSGERPTRIQVCNSDSDGAFKVYRLPATVFEVQPDIAPTERERLYGGTPAMGWDRDFFVRITNGKVVSYHSADCHEIIERHTCALAAAIDQPEAAGEDAAKGA